MGFRDTLANVIAGSSINQRIKEAVDAKLKEGSVPAQASNKGGDNEDYGYRVLGGGRNGGAKSFNPVKQDKMQKICYWLYDMNGLAHRMSERYCDFVVGDGMSFSCKDPQVEDLLKKHWEDEQNDWERKQYQKVKELSIYGEQFLPVFVNKVDGFVRLGYDDPQEVTEVKTKEGNPEIQTEYIVSRTGQETKPVKIINLNVDTESAEYEYLTGQAFFFSINAVANQPRGRSDLLTLADNIDTYEQYLFNRAERADILTRIIYDLEIQGANAKDIRAILKELPMPKSNEFWGHNEKMKLNVQSPNLGGQDASAEAKLLFNNILAGAGFPPHWFAGGEGLTRATAMQMDLPTKKQLKTRQGYFRWMMKRIFRFCIHQAILAKQLKPEQRKAQIKINLPKIEEKEIEIIASALVSLTNSLVSATEEGWVTKVQATKVYLYVLSNIGMEFEEAENPDAQIEKALESIDPKLREIYCQKKRAKAGETKTEEEEE